VVGGTSVGAVAEFEVARCQGKTAGAGKLGAICGGAVFNADRGGWMPDTALAACTAAGGTAPCGSPAINGLVPWCRAWPDGGNVTGAAPPGIVASSAQGKLPCGFVAGKLTGCLDSGCVCARPGPFNCGPACVALSAIGQGLEPYCNCGESAGCGSGWVPSSGDQALEPYKSWAEGVTLRGAGGIACWMRATCCGTWGAGWTARAVASPSCDRAGPAIHAKGL